MYTYKTMLQCTVYAILLAATGVSFLSFAYDNTNESTNFAPPLVAQERESIRALSGAAIRRLVALSGEVGNSKNIKGLVDTELLRAAESSIVLLNNNTKNAVPYQNLDKKRFFVLEIGNASASFFLQRLGDYAKIGTARLAAPDRAAIEQLIATHGARYNNVIVALNGYALDAQRDADFIDLLTTKSKVVATTVVNFATADNLAFIDKNIVALHAETQDSYRQDAAAQILFGGTAATGRLAAAHGQYAAGAGDATVASRFQFVAPEAVGASSEKMVALERIVNDAMSAHAFPGCQVLVAKNGKVCYNKSFGYMEYNGYQAVSNDNLYDLASITKTAATTISVMQSIDKGLISLDGRLGDYLDIPNSTLRTHTVREFLTHTSGLSALMPVQQYMNANINAYRCAYAKGCTVKVADGLYIPQSVVDNIYNTIYTMPTPSRGGFKYSDVNMNVLLALLEDRNNQRIDELTNAAFYKQMGLWHIGYSPTKRFSPQAIAPTEQDNTFRTQLLRGYVHDEGAALLGGVAGNAGLFSNALDLAVVYQMLLNNGTYGNIQYIQSATVQQFVGTTAAHHRGLGFDKQSTDRKTTGCGKLASIDTYGHTGFTGNCVWADPQNQLLFVFLSNRVYPNRSNVINKLDVRERVHDAIYAAFQ